MKSQYSYVIILPFILLLFSCHREPSFPVNKDVYIGVWVDTTGIDKYSYQNAIDTNYINKRGVNTTIFLQNDGVCYIMNWKLSRQRDVLDSIRNYYAPLMHNFRIMKGVWYIRKGYIDLIIYKSISQVMLVKNPYSVDCINKMTKKNVMDSAFKRIQWFATYVDSERKLTLNHVLLVKLDSSMPSMDSVPTWGQ